jgi:uroporphyrinogen-III synthase
MRCLVLRPRDQAEATAARLSQLGHAALVAPILTIVPTGTAPPAGDFTGIVLTSANALQGFRSLRTRFAADLPVWVVGARTAEALARDGIADVVSAAEAGELAASVIASSPPGRILLIGGRDRKREPESALTAAGFEVARWDSYRAEIVDALPEPVRAALHAGSLDIALHYSRRSADAALALAAAAGVAREFCALRHLCLSPDVAAALAAIPPDRVAVAERPDETALLGLIGTGSQTPHKAGSRGA